MYLPIERFEVDGLEVAVLEELKDQMRASIREARGRHTVADLGPGKFAGPLT